MNNTTIKLSIKTQIHVNRCECGWQFMALDKSIKYCPQCRDTYLFKCLCCGKEVEKLTAKYCNECAPEVKRIYNMHYMRRKRNSEKFKDIITSNTICDYDCFNCKYSDCLIEIDKN